MDFDFNNPPKKEWISKGFWQFLTITFLLSTLLFGWTGSVLIEENTRLREIHTEHDEKINGLQDYVERLRDMLLECGGRLKDCYEEEHDFGAESL